MMISPKSKEPGTKLLNEKTKGFAYALQTLGKIIGRNYNADIQKNDYGKCSHPCNRSIQSDYGETCGTGWISSALIGLEDFPEIKRRTVEQ